MYIIKDNILSASCVASMLFLAVVSLGISLAIIPLYVNNNFTSFLVGFLVAIQSVSTLLTRAIAGNYSDSHGPRKGMFLGLILAFISGFMCVFIFYFPAEEYFTFTSLLLSRIIMGVGESFIFTCSGTWSIGLIGRHHAGKIMSWVGMAMFLGLSLGTYVGTRLFYDKLIIEGAIVMSALPIAGVIIAIFIRPVSIVKLTEKNTLLFAIKRVWKPGLSFAMANTGYAVITTYLVLFFSANGWEKEAAFALSLFSIGYVFSRVTLGWLADSSGVKMTVFSLVIEVTGLLLIATSTSPIYAMIGSFLTGYGLSMVYPLLAIPALKKMPQESTGLALSTYESCFDLGMLSAGFIGGIIISIFNFNCVFYLSMILCVISIFLSISSYRQMANN